jgi:hypothetical protein
LLRHQKQCTDLTILEIQEGLKDRNMGVGRR